MTKKVIALNPDALAPGEVDAEIVELLERYLAQAKRGEVTGVGIVVCRPNDHIGTEWCGVSGAKFPLGYAIGLLNTRYYLAQIEQNRG